MFVFLSPPSHQDSSLSSCRFSQLDTLKPLKEVFLDLKLSYYSSVHKTYPNDSGSPHLGKNATIDIFALHLAGCDGYCSLQKHRENIFWSRPVSGQTSALASPRGCFCPGLSRSLLRGEPRWLSAGRWTISSLSWNCTAPSLPHWNIMYSITIENWVPRVKWSYFVVVFL